MCITYISYGYSSKTILYIRVPRAHPRREGSRVRLLHGLRRVRVPAVAVPGGGHPLGRAADEAHRAGVQVQKLPLRAVRPPNRAGAAGRRAAAVLTRSF